MAERDAVSKLLWSTGGLKEEALRRATAAWDALPEDADRPDFNIFRNAVIGEALANADADLKARIQALIEADRHKKAEKAVTRRTRKRCVVLLFEPSLWLISTSTLQ